MKKLMMVLAVVAVAAVAQAASIDWSITANTWTYKDATKAAASTPVYLINAAEWSTIKTAIEGGKTAFTTSDKGILAVGSTANAKGYVAESTASSASLTAGTSYNYAYLVFDTRDAENIQYFASGTMTAAAYDKNDPTYSEAMSIQFGATQYSTSPLSGGWTAAAPEPTSGLLLLIGLAGVALKRKRA